MPPSGSGDAETTTLLRKVEKLTCVGISASIQAGCTAYGPVKNRLAASRTSRTGSVVVISTVIPQITSFS